MAVIKGEDVLDTYAEVVPNAADMAEKYLGAVWQNVHANGIPVKIAYEDASTGLIKAAMGKKRQFLVMNPQASQIDVFRVMHFATSVGNVLSLGWYLTGRTRGFGNSGIRIPVIDSLDLFGNADLHAVIDSIHEFGVMPAVYEVAEASGYPRGEINKKSVGLFGVG